MKKRKVFTIFLSLFLFLAVFLFMAARWLHKSFGNLTYEKLIFHMKMPIGGADPSFVISFIIEVIFFTLFFFVLALLLINSSRIFHSQIYLRLGFRGKQERSLRLRIFPLTILHKTFPLIVLFSLVLVSLYSYSALNLKGIFSYQFETSSIYEEHYIHPDEAGIQFPEKPRNLIVIFAESMETSFTSRELGGYWKEDYIPELTDLALNNVSFSDTDRLGGPQPAFGMGWTIAAMVSHTAGIPLNLPIYGNSMDRYAYFLPEAVTLGDILHEQGYQQTYLIGSDKTFGGRSLFFSQHGWDNIKDYYHYIINGSLPGDYRVWWGFEDQKLFTFAREELGSLSRSGEPFNLTLLTVDTHHPNGYVCSQCPDIYDEQFGNVLRCSSRQISEFVEWVQQQDFYENTTIAIFGDHLSMNKIFFENVPADYQRHPFNAFINAPLTPHQEKSRIYTTIDYFPTLLESLDVTIDAPGLGLGRSLWKEGPTLPEAMGFDTFNREISKKSELYDFLLYGRD